ncbi:MAG: hypothetical protein AAFU63_05005 [Pseudomonadota bacterium]
MLSTGGILARAGLRGVILGAVSVDAVTYAHHRSAQVRINIAPDAAGQLGGDAHHCAQRTRVAARQLGRQRALKRARCDLPHGPLQAHALMIGDLPIAVQNLQQDRVHTAHRRGVGTGPHGRRPQQPTPKDNATALHFLHSVMPHATPLHVTLEGHR